MTKERKAYHLTDVKQTCYRQIKFKPNDRRYQCPFKFESIQDLCYNCKWLHIEPRSTFQASGEEAETVAKFIRNFMSTKVLSQKDTEDCSVEKVNIQIKESSKNLL